MSGAAPTLLCSRVDLASLRIEITLGADPSLTLLHHLGFDGGEARHPAELSTYTIRAFDVSYFWDAEKHAEWDRLTPAERLRLTQQGEVTRARQQNRRSRAMMHTVQAMEEGAAQFLVKAMLSAGLSHGWTLHLHESPFSSATTRSWSQEALISSGYSLAHFARDVSSAINGGTAVMTVEMDEATLSTAHNILLPWLRLDSTAKTTELGFSSQDPGLFCSVEEVCDVVDQAHLIPRAATDDGLKLTLASLHETLKQATSSSSGLRQLLGAVEVQAKSLVGDINFGIAPGAERPDPAKVAAAFDLDLVARDKSINMLPLGPTLHRMLDLALWHACPFSGRPVWTSSRLVPRAISETWTERPGPLPLLMSTDDQLLPAVLVNSCWVIYENTAPHPHKEKLKVRAGQVVLLRSEYTTRSGSKKRRLSEEATGHRRQGSGVGGGGEEHERSAAGTSAAAQGNDAPTGDDEASDAGDEASHQNSEPSDEEDELSDVGYGLGLGFAGARQGADLHDWDGKVGTKDLELFQQDHGQQVVSGRSQVNVDVAASDAGSESFHSASGGPLTESMISERPAVPSPEASIPASQSDPVISPTHVELPFEMPRSINPRRSAKRRLRQQRSSSQPSVSASPELLLTAAPEPSLTATPAPAGFQYDESSFWPDAGSDANARLSAGMEREGYVSDSGSEEAYVARAGMKREAGESSHDADPHRRPTTRPTGSDIDYGRYLDDWWVEGGGWPYSESDTRSDGCPETRRAKLELDVVLADVLVAPREKHARFGFLQQWARSADATSRGEFDEHCRARKCSRDRIRDILGVVKEDEPGMRQGGFPTARPRVEGRDALQLKAGILSAATYEELCVSLDRTVFFLVLPLLLSGELGKLSALVAEVEAR